MEAVTEFAKVWKQRIIPAVILFWLASCSGHEASMADTSCEAKAARNALDSSCVIELARTEIAKHKRLSYSKYSVHFDARENEWVIMAYNESDPPDSHTFVLIGPDGALRSIK
jgi:hypothetical protein